MSEEPDIAAIAALIGEPARAKLLMALMGGQALTATELANAGGVTKQTASSHLRRLCEARLLAVEAQGRHRYFRLADGAVAQLLESLFDLSTRLAAPLPPRFGPRDPVLRRARVCYDHLAGEIAVELFERVAPRCFVEPQHGLQLNARGILFFRDFGIDVDALSAQKRPLCRTCLDWSARRHHLAGALGAALLDRFFALGWARRVRRSRAVLFTAQGEFELRRQFRLAG
ncbi:MAG: helix-turn-helix transcriptional regulator [Proteobacteria bacterium]|uniref:ArsR/SmtB family transcription factor n=1 Tax=Rudaea sp. TaxID=2136325 RepID=UPI001DA1531D|nr:helix-turn-helix transcriptional regulator [Pseudomonadota bacterium]MBS0568224.1 helix-turn-helix transcriptional regulator [Pseudomonadota bacterium]